MGKDHVTTGRVLLVEDEGLIRMVAAEALQDEGFEVVEAWDGEEAARLLDGPVSFDVLFTDVRMPGSLDGMDVAMHARRRYPAIPVLLVSGFAANIMCRIASMQPRAIFINKPYSLEEVVRAVSRLAARF